MPGILGLGHVQPIRAFALELSKAREAAAPLSPVALAEHLGVSRSRVENFFDGSATPDPVELTLLLVALHPSITVAEVAAWQTCLRFATALAIPAGYQGDPVREFLRILRPLDSGPGKRYGHLGSYDRHFRQKPAGLPSPDNLQAYLAELFPLEWRRVPWLLAYDFAREILGTATETPDASHRPGWSVWDDPRARATHLPSPAPSDDVRQQLLVLESRARDLLAEAEAGAEPLTIFISDENESGAVESAVAAWLEARGLEVVHEGEPVFGSYWKAFLTRLRKGADDHVDDGLALAGRAVGLYGLDTRQAEVNQREAEAFAKVMEALANVDSAIIHHGTLLVVKHGGTVVRRELSQLEVEALRQNPILTTRPDIILKELQRHAHELGSQPNVG